MWRFSALAVLVAFVASIQCATATTATPVAIKSKLCDKAFLLNSYNAPKFYAEPDGKKVLRIKESKGVRFRQVAALNGDPNGVSFEAVSDSLHYLTNSDAVISVAKTDNSATFKSESTFKIVAGPEGYYRIASIIHPNHFMRHQNFIMKLHKWSDTDLYRNDTLFRFVCTSDKENKLDICDGDFQLESKNFPDFEVEVSPGKISEIVRTQNGTRFRFVNPAINGNPKAVSIMSADHKNTYLSNTADHMIELTPFANNDKYKAAASFRVLTLRDGYVRFQSAENPRHYIRHSSHKLRLDGWSDTDLYHKDSAWKIECAIIPCADKHWVYNRKYEKAEGPHCVFAPAKWWQISAACHDKAANRPSPILIETQLCKAKDPSLKPLKFGPGWHDERKFLVVNNGHSIQANVKDATDLTVEGARLNGTFEAVQFHFHWGSEASMKAGNGSEHVLLDKEGKKEDTPIEVHIVCKQKGLTMQQAVQQTDKIAVFGAFIRPLQKNEHDGWVAHIIAQIFADLSKIAAPGASHGAHAASAVEMEIQLRDLLPEKVKYINYDGAFTTPGCNPVAQWHIFPKPMHVHEYLVKKFTKLFFDAEKKKPMVDNFRPLQGRHSRPYRCN